MRLFDFRCSISLVFAMLSLISGCGKFEDEPYRDEKEKDEGGKNAKAQEAEPPPLAQVLRWNEAVHSYTATLKSTMSAGASQVMLKLDMASEINLLPVEVKSREDLLLMVLVNPEVRIEGESKPSKEQQERLTLELSQPVWGRFRGGKLQKLYLPESPSAFAVGIWRTLFSGIQVSMPLNGIEESHQTTELDNNGEYRVVYRRVAKGKWQKKKLSYVKGLHSPDSESPIGLSPTPKLLSSTGEVVIADNRLQTSSLDESIDVPLNQGRGLSGATKLEIERKGEGAAPEPGARLTPPKSALVLNAEEPFIQELPIDAMDDQRMKGLTFEDTLKALVARSRDPRRKALWQKKNQEEAKKKDQKAAQAWTEDWARYFTALPAFFRQKPETLARVEKEIRKGSPATTSLLGGLSSSGSPEAQAVLARLALDEKLDEELRLSAIRNLVQCRMPTKKTAEVVWDLTDDPLLSRYTVFGIGIIARKFRKNGEPEEAARILEQLLTRLSALEDPHEKRDVLRGISNTGDPAAYTAMSSLANDPDPTIRGGAVEAVRLMKIPEADQLIADRISFEIESAAGVRVSAINAASKRSHEDPVLAALISAASDDPDTKVTKAARKLLLSWSKESSELTSILQGIADADEAKN